MRRQTPTNSRMLYWSYRGPPESHHRRPLHLQYCIVSTTVTFDISGCMVVDQSLETTAFDRAREVISEHNIPLLSNAYGDRSPTRYLFKAYGGDLRLQHPLLSKVITTACCGPAKSISKYGPPTTCRGSSTSKIITS